jgi:hypothetical protein
MRGLFVMMSHEQAKIDRDDAHNQTIPLSIATNIVTTNLEIQLQ